MLWWNSQETVCWRRGRGTAVLCCLDYSLTVYDDGQYLGDRHMVRSSVVHPADQLTIHSIILFVYFTTNCNNIKIIFIGTHQTRGKKKMSSMKNRRVCTTTTSTTRSVCAATPAGSTWRDPVRNALAASRTRSSATCTLQTWPSWRARISCSSYAASSHSRSAVPWPDARAAPHSFSHCLRRPVPVGLFIFIFIIIFFHYYLFLRLFSVQFLVFQVKNLDF